MRRISRRSIVILIAAAAILLMGATVPLAIWVTHTQTAQTANEQARCSSTMQPVHKVILKDDKAMPDKITALQCDTLEFINEDDGIKLMAFGPHEHRVSYDGVSERALGPGQSFSVKLVQVGTFHFHNHITDGSQGNFTVSK